MLSRLKLLQLFAELIGDGLQVPASTALDFTDSRARMRQLIQQIPEAELMRCSVVDLAKKICCSQRHFSRLFREEVGVSLREKQKNSGSNVPVISWNRARTRSSISPWMRATRA